MKNKFDKIYILIIYKIIMNENTNQNKIKEDASVISSKLDKLDITLSRILENNIDDNVEKNGIKTDNKENKMKKKKKKTNYKSLIQQIIQSDKTDEQMDKEYMDKIKKSMGGGTFSKIDKI